jgi:xanthine/CO dehydrogenase XdhC/CoxF family maturation factor
VEVFIERVDARSVGPLGWMGCVIDDRRSCAVATVVRGGAGIDVGARLLVNDDGSVEGALKESAIGRSVVEWIASATETVEARVLKVGGAEVFVELIAAAQGVVIFGGGPDVLPVVRMAKELGWHVTVVAARPATGLGERFALADRFLVTSSDEPLAGVCVEPDAAVVLMTHNFPRDVRILAGLEREPRYLGILGPRARTLQLMDEVGSIGHWDVRGPIGLDLGAESPEEIALAIVGEIQAVVRGAAAGFLRERAGPIHERVDAAAVAPVAVDSAAQRGARCAM